MNRINYSNKAISNLNRICKEEFGYNLSIIFKLDKHRTGFIKYKRACICFLYIVHDMPIGEINRLTGASSTAINNAISKTKNSDIILTRIREKY